MTGGRAGKEGGRRGRAGQGGEAAGALCKHISVLHMLCHDAKHEIQRGETFPCMERVAEIQGGTTADPGR
eukprot:763241-Hanusia_phi.AAC.4